MTKEENKIEEAEEVTEHFDPAKIQFLVETNEGYGAWGIGMSVKEAMKNAEVVAESRFGHCCFEIEYALEGFNVDGKGKKLLEYFSKHNLDEHYDGTFSNEVKGRVRIIGKDWAFKEASQNIGGFNLSFDWHGEGNAPKKLPEKLKGFHFTVKQNGRILIHEEENEDE